MEEAVSFGYGADVLRGVRHGVAEGDQRDVGIVFLHGWSGCRLGPHRMFVKAARRFAEKGYPSLRFDFRGRGESDGETTEASIQSMIADTRAAAAFLRTEAGVSNIVLLGICSGGKVAIGAAAEHPGIAGLVLWSCESMGYLRSGAVKRRKSLFALRQYAGKMLRPATWRKILSLNVNVGQVKKAVFTDESPDEREIRAESDVLDRFSEFKGRVLFVCGGNDPETKVATARYERFCTRSKIDAIHHAIADANHSFYSLAWEAEVIEKSEQWLVNSEWS